MKIIEFMQKMKELTDDGGWGTQHFFDKEFDGCCPFFKGMVEVDGKDLNVAGRCWRVSDNAKDSVETLVEICVAQSQSTLKQQIRKEIEEYIKTLWEQDLPVQPHSHLPYPELEYEKRGKLKCANDFLSLPSLQDTNKGGE